MLSLIFAQIVLASGTGIAGRRPPAPRTSLRRWLAADLRLAEVAAAAARLIAASVITTAILDASVDPGARKQALSGWRKTHEMIVIADDFTGSNDTGVQLAAK